MASDLRSTSLFFQNHTRLMNRATIILAMYPQEFNSYCMHEVRISTSDCPGSQAEKRHCLAMAAIFAKAERVPDEAHVGPSLPRPTHLNIS